MCGGASSSVREVSAARSASVSGSGAKRRRRTGGDGVGIHAALELEHAEHPRARRVGVHQPGARRAPAQHVPDQARNRGTVAGAGIAMRGAPLLQRLRRGNALRVDGVDQFDGGGEPGGGGHRAFSTNGPARERRSDQQQQLQREVDPHRQQHQHAGKPGQAALLELLDVTKMPAWAKRVTTNTQDISTMKRSAWRSGSASAIRK